MNEDCKRGARDKGITKTDYEVALWTAHMDRLRANVAYCRKPGEKIPSPSEYLQPCESGDSFDEEMKKLIAAGDRAFHDACLRAQKRVQAFNEFNAQIRELKIGYLTEMGQYLDGFGKLDPADPQYSAKRKSLVQKIIQVHGAYSALPR
jgi:hypothetical protein